MENEYIRARFERVEKPTLEAAFFSDAYDLSSKTGSNTDRDYGVPSPARQKFNDAFDEFRAIQSNEGSETAFVKTQDKMLDSIIAADDYTERAQSVFYSQLAPDFMKDDRPTAEVIEKLQIMSAALNQVLPGEREELMRQLAAGNFVNLKSYPEVKEALEKIDSEFAKEDMGSLLKSWLDYRAGLGDSIGQRQVFIGLCERFGSAQLAREHEAKVLELKNRVGGRYLWD